MKNSFFLIFCIISFFNLISSKLNAQKEVLKSMGAQAGGLQNQLLSNNDLFAAYNNPCTPILSNDSSKDNTSNNQFRTGIWAERIFNLSEFTNGGFTLGIKHKKNNFSGISANLTNRLGGFNRYQVCLSSAQRLSDKIALGVKLSYFAERIQNYSNSDYFSGSIFFNINPIPKWMLAFSLQNPNFKKGTDELQSKISTSVLISSSYQFSNQITGYSELEKTEGMHLIAKLGFIYHPAKKELEPAKYDFLLGCRNIPNKINSDDILLTLGFNFHSKGGISILTAFEIHPYLGVSSHAGLGFSN